MKKTCYLLMAVLLGLAAKQSLAQDCATGFCPETITVHHKAGDVSPIDIDITYEVGQTNAGTSGDKCWILQNLGASRVASGYSDISFATRGWYWQWGSKRGYNVDGIGITPTWGVGYNSPASWTDGEDPCGILLGNSWRVPTSSDVAGMAGWNTDAAGLYTGYGLKLILSGYLSDMGTEYDVGSSVRLWLSEGYSSISGWMLMYGGSGMAVTDQLKTFGSGIRCVMIL